MSIKHKKASLYSLKVIPLIIILFATCIFQSDMAFGENGGLSHSITNGLVLHYTFDADDGTNVFDESGNGNDGVLRNSPEYVDGVMGQGLFVEGVNATFSDQGDHVIIPFIDFSEMSEFTIGLWVKRIALEYYAGEYLISFGMAGSPQGCVYMSANPGITGALYQVSSSALICPQDDYADTNKFVHYCMTYSNSVLTAYKDGAVCGVTNGVVVYMEGTNSALARHWWPSGTSTRLTGILDDVRIYNRALSEEEVAGLYTNATSEVDYYLDTTAGLNGSVDVGDGWYTNGVIVEINAIADSGYEFTGWTGDVPSGEETSNPLSLTMDMDRAVTANFDEVIASTNDLILYYSFDVDNGATVVDESGTGNDGVLYGEGTWVANGVRGGAYDFDGVDDWIMVDDDDSLTPATGELTLSAWVYFDEATWPARTAILNKYYWATNERDWWLGLGHQNQSDKTCVALNIQEFGTGVPTGSNCLIYGSSPIQGQWNHVVGTFSSNHMVIYINGVKDTERVHDDIADKLGNQNEPLYIGYFRDDDTYFKGMMDEIMIYNRALSGAEVIDLYMAGVDYYLDTTAGLNGSVDVGDGWHPGGAVIEITATADEGYEFAGWTGDVPGGQETDNPLTLTMDTDCAVTANFDEVIVPTNYLILHYTFDADNGATVTDESGAGNDGRRVNTTEYVDGVMGQGLFVEGVNATFSDQGGHVIIPFIDFSEMPEFTIGLWVKQIALEYYDGEHFISFGLAGPPQGCVRIKAAPNITGSLYQAGGDKFIVYSEEGYPTTDRFVHYCMTYSNGVLTAYKDGAVCGVTNGVVVYMEGTNSALARHWWNYGGEICTATRLTGILDDVRIYNRALSKEEVAGLYANATSEVDYYLDTAAGANGSVDVGDGWHTDGAIVEITATADEGYEFAGWTGDVPGGQETSNPLTLTMDMDRSVTATFEVVVPPPAKPLTINDFDGDGKTDFGCYTQDGGHWHFAGASNKAWQASFGYSGTVPVTGDFDGDGKMDYGCYDAEGRFGQPPGSWYLMQSSAGFKTYNFGYSGTVPVTGDFDGDGKVDYGCYDADGRFGQSSGSWYVMQSRDGFKTYTFGYSGTIPIVGDFDGDGLTDFGCYDAEGRFKQAPGSWYIMQSRDGFRKEEFGYPHTIPVTGDFDGDGKTDFGCYDSWGQFGQPSGSWYLMQTQDGFREETFGYPGTVPVTGDFDGDGVTDYGCYDAAGYFGQAPGSWYIMQSKDGFRTATFGNKDSVAIMALPVESAKVPESFMDPSDLANSKLLLGQWVFTFTVDFAFTFNYDFTTVDHENLNEEGGYSALGVDIDHGGSTVCGEYWPDHGDWTISQRRIRDRLVYVFNTDGFTIQDGWVFIVTMNQVTGVEEWSIPYEVTGYKIVRQR